MNTDRLHPSVFLSYSWDTEKHKSWVRTLAERLVRNGVQVKLDVWDVTPGESLAHFMEDSVHECDFNIVICTPNYATKSNNRERGVGYEQQIISGNILAGVERKKFIPIVRSGTFDMGPNCAIPRHFLGILALDFTTEEQDHSFEELLRVIFNSPRFKPPELGQMPDFSEADESTNTDIRLPDVELDGYELISGVASNRKNPETFYVPTADERNSLMKQDIVKLNFMISLTNSADDLSGERMWVEVEGHEGPYLFGSLSNQPFDSDESGAPLSHGDRIVFLPEHVISIITKAEAEKKEQEREQIVAEISEEEAISISESAQDPETRRQMILSGLPLQEIQDKFSIEYKFMENLVDQKPSWKSKLVSLIDRFKK